MDTALELNKTKSGNCYGIFCDHKNDNEVDDVFKQIIQTHKRLDLMINNAFSGGDVAAIKSTYISSVKASRIMIEQKSGLIVNISSMGGLVPMFGPLYSVGKEGSDRMAVDMGLALKSHNVTVISLWPGVVKTEASLIIKDKPGNEQELLE
ncbi:hypothetical protein MXB_2503 [Myxobolus squamalis]|nr:hypothetical protein MXB_2503 [Myxobolus squamalis]